MVTLSLHRHVHPALRYSVSSALWPQLEQIPFTLPRVRFSTIMNCIPDMAASRFVPRDKLAFRILITAVEDAPFLAAAFDDLAFPTLRTIHPDILDNRLRIATFREAGASEELAETSHLIDERFAALFASFIGNLVLDFHVSFISSSATFSRFSNVW